MKYKYRTAINKRALIYSATGFIVVLLFGYLIMRAFWAWGAHGAGPGFFKYWAASYGDCIALPLLTAGLIYICKCAQSEERKRTKKEFATQMALFLPGIIFGMGIQLKWLIKETTPVNWTFKGKGAFNPAGKYHGIFFALFCGWLSFLFINAIIVQWRNLVRGKEEKMSLLAVFFTAFAGTYYFTLHFIDDGVGKGIILSNRNYELAYLYAAIIVFFVMMVLFIGPILLYAKRMTGNRVSLILEKTKKVFFGEMGPVFSGIIAGIAATSLMKYFIVGGTPIVWVFVIALALLSLVLWKAKESVQITIVSNVILFTLPVICFSLVFLRDISSCINNPYVSLISFLVPIILLSLWLVWVAIEGEEGVEDEITVNGILILYFLVAFWFYKSSDRTMTSFFSVLSFAGVFLSTRACRLVFAPNTRREMRFIERKSKEENILDRQGHITVGLGYVKVLAVLFPCIGWTLYEILGDQFRTYISVNGFFGPRAIIVILSLVVSVVCLFVWATKKAKFLNCLLFFVYIFVVVAFILLTVTFNEQKQFDNPLGDQIETNIAWFFVFVSFAFQVFGVTKIMGKEYYFNAYALRAQKKKEVENRVEKTSKIIKWGTCASLVITGLVTFCDKTIASGLVLFVLLPILFVLVPYVSCKIQMREVKLKDYWDRMVFGKATIEMIKDTSTLCLIMLVGTIVPVLLLRGKGSNNVVHYLVYVFCALSQLVSILVFAIECNKEHYQMLVRHVNSDELATNEQFLEDANDSLKELKTWLRYQSKYVIIASCIYGGIFLYCYYNVNSPLGLARRKGFKAFVSGMINITEE